MVNVIKSLEMPSYTQVILDGIDLTKIIKAEYKPTITTVNFVNTLDSVPTPTDSWDV